MSIPSTLYRWYEGRLKAGLPADGVPRHVAVILDGNRRWAKAAGENPSAGHRAGANKIADFLGWSEEVGVELVTLWMLSTDNLDRPAGEIADLLEIIEHAVEDLAKAGRWRIRPVGALELLPAATRAKLEACAARTAGIDGLHVNVAVGYGGRREIADAVRSLLAEQAAAGASLEQVAEIVDVEHIAAHLYTSGQPDPDLVIRTSGEQRLSGFLMWQSVHSEFYFHEAYWPDFRKVDYLRALRDYAVRERRLGR